MSRKESKECSFLGAMFLVCRDGFFERNQDSNQDELSNLQRGKKNKNARFVHLPWMLPGSGLNPH